METCDVSGKERGVCAIVVFCVQEICEPGFVRGSAQYSARSPSLVIDMSIGYSCVTGTKMEKINLEVDET